MRKLARICSLLLAHAHGEHFSTDANGLDKCEAGATR